MNELTFSRVGVCRILLEGLPEPFDIEKLIESYVREVELLPYPLKVILLDISELVHLQVRSRQVFSGLLIEASRKYAGEIQFVIAGGPPMIRKFAEIMCKASKFGDRTHSFAILEEAKAWIKDFLTGQTHSESK